MTQNKYLIITITVSLAVLSVLSTDFYVPAMPDMVNLLATNHYMIKTSVTVYMLGMAFAPLVFGPISDRYGRKPVLISCAALGLIGSLLCWLAPTALLLIAGRLMQGIGLGASLSLGRTIGNDLFEKQEFAQVAGVISVFTSLGPAIAPVIGGFLHLHFGWRSIFLLLTALITICLIAIIKKVPETIAERDLNALHVSDLIRNYRELMTDKFFMGNSIAAGLSISVVILFGVLSTFIFQNDYHLSAMHCAWIMLLVTGSGFISRSVNVILLRSRSAEQIVSIGLNFMLVGAIMATVTSALQMHFIISIIIPAMLLVFGSCIIPPNTVAIALAPYRHKGGIAGAIYGFITMFCVFTISLLSSMLPTSSFMLAIILLAISALTWLMTKLALLSLQQRQLNV